MSDPEFTIRANRGGAAGFYIHVPVTDPGMIRAIYAHALSTFDTSPHAETLASRIEAFAADHTIDLCLIDA